MWGLWRKQTTVKENDQLQLRALMTQYIDYLEITPSKEICECEWKTNVPAPGGKKIKMLGDVSFDCPVHTREGLLFGFFDWVKKQGIDIRDLLG